MKKAETVKKLVDCGVIAVVRADSAEQAFRIIDACLEGGVLGIEITFTVPGAQEVIRQAVEKYKDTDAVIGAGTVLDAETGRAAILVGAQFVVSPCLNVELVKLCNRYQIPVMPGAMTVTEAVNCAEAGADIIKIFPANLFGPKIIKAIRGPLPQLSLMPTGGVNAENAGEWIKAGAVAVGAGSDLTAGAKTGDYASITSIGSKMVAEVRKARGL